MKWWLVTWSTYGTWLPGDPRGFQTWRGMENVPPPIRYAKPGEKIYAASEYEDRYRTARVSMKGQPITLNPSNRRIALNALVEKIDELLDCPSIIAVAGEHCHLLAKFGALEIRPTIGFVKAAATRKLHERGFEQDDPWAKECHIKSKREGREFQVAFEYVHRHIDQGAEVYVWPDFQDLIRA